MKRAIRQERLRRGWTQEDVAKQVGLTRTAVSDIENGKQRPSYRVLLRLEEIFEMSHSELMSEAEDLSSEDN